MPGRLPPLREGGVEALPRGHYPRLTFDNHANIFSGANTIGKPQAVVIPIYQDATWSRFKFRKLLHMRWVFHFLTRYTSKQMTAHIFGFGKGCIVYETA